MKTVSANAVGYMGYWIIPQADQFHVYGSVRRAPYHRANSLLAAQKWIDKLMEQAAIDARKQA